MILPYIAIIVPSVTGFLILCYMYGSLGWNNDSFFKKIFEGAKILLTIVAFIAGFLALLLPVIWGLAELGVING